MTLTQAHDFLTECQILHEAIAGLTDTQLTTPTQFKGWTIEDILIHLHFWNRAADLSATDTPAFQALVTDAMQVLQQGGSLREVEPKHISERGTALRDAWIAQARDMAPRWSAMDPKARLPWVGPSMSARSSITARQMETWAHGFEIFDVLGLDRTETDRIRNIVVLGVNTFGWSHKVHGLPVPETMPHLTLTAPSGAVWTYGDKTAGDISGPAVDFAAVVTQTRALADTALTVSGATAETWMANAQCFAGPPEVPPAPGTRVKTA